MCAVVVVAPYKRADNNTLAFVAQLMLLFVLSLAMVVKLYKDIEDTSLSTKGASTIMGFSDPFVRSNASARDLWTCFSHSPRCPAAPMACFSDAQLPLWRPP